MKIEEKDVASGRITLGIDPARPGGDGTGMTLIRPLGPGRYEVVGSMKVQHFDADFVRRLQSSLARRSLEDRLRQRRVGEAVIERVMRLNPHPREGDIPRGFHYKDGWSWGIIRGLVQKGAVLRDHGLKVWASIPRDSITKRGRREWVSELTLRKVLREAAISNTLRGVDG